MLSWKVGEVTITRVQESMAPLDAREFFAGAGPEAVERGLARHAGWLRPNFLKDDHTLRLSIHAFVLEVGGRRLVVDTCIGNQKTLNFPDLGGRGEKFLDDLRDAGHPVESVDTVLCTHLHFDHVGWNTRLVDGRWIPTFPRARYLFARREWEHWSQEKEDGFASGPTVLGESVQPVLDAGLADLVDVRHRVCDEIWLEPTPGHTPGHVCVHIRSRGEEAVITGDLVHHPVQLAEASWGIGADVDPAQASETRRSFAARCANRPVLVLGTHFAPPTAGRIVGTEGAYRFVA